MSHVSADILTPPAEVDAKQQQILAAATEAFLAFGFRRCSMAEIAARAGMSRAALYLHYKNKEDIYASLVARFYDEAAAGFAAGLSAGTSPTEALRAGLRGKLSVAFQGIAASPHGPELLNVSATLGGSVVAQGESALFMVLSSWLTEGARDGRLDLTRLGGSADGAASLILDAVSGVKAGVKEMSQLPARLDALAEVFGAALHPTN